MNSEPSVARFDLSPRRDEPLLRFVTLAEGLTVQSVDRRRFGSITVDLASSSILRRAAQGRGGLLAKAILPAPDKPMPLVWDVTAGLGRDAMTLALLGCEVVAFERNPFLGMLILDGHRRAKAEEGDVGVAARRITGRIEDARRALERVDQEEARPDAILVDPMFPEGKGRAAVKKEAALLRALVAEGHNPEQDAELFTLALQMATWRVAVKRSLRAPNIVENPAPQATFTGKSVRIDRYSCSG